MSWDYCCCCCCSPFIHDIDARIISLILIAAIAESAAYEARTIWLHHLTSLLLFSALCEGYERKATNQSLALLGERDGNLHNVCPLPGVSSYSSERPFHFSLLNLLSFMKKCFTAADAAGRAVMNIV